MITTLLLDIGGTVYIKNQTGFGEINPAILYLLENIPPTITTVIVSDTETFDIHELLMRDVPQLANCAIFSKKDFPWIDKTKPETYLKICEQIHTNPIDCALIDNQENFRIAAQQAGITPFGVSQEETLRFLQSLN